MAGGYNIRAERVVDGDASTLTALTLYEAGSPDTERTLLATEVLHICDGQIITETAGDVQLVVDTAAASRYLVNTKSAAGHPIRVLPYICEKGVVPKFAGVSSNRNSCILNCFIREA